MFLNFSYITINNNTYLSINLSDTVYILKFYNPNTLKIFSEKLGIYTVTAKEILKYNCNPKFNYNEILVEQDSYNYSIIVNYDNSLVFIVDTKTRELTLDVVMFKGEILFYIKESVADRFKDIIYKYKHKYGYYKHTNPININKLPENIKNAICTQIILTSLKEE